MVVFDDSVTKIIFPVFALQSKVCALPHRIFRHASTVLNEIIYKYSKGLSSNVSML